MERFVCRRGGDCERRKGRGKKQVRNSARGRKERTGTPSKKIEKRNRTFFALALRQTYEGMGK